MTSAARQWADELAAWAIDPEILAAVPDSPYALPPGLFRADASTTAVPCPAVDIARAALPEGGSVLDVGVGAGATSLPLFPPAAHLHAVDSQPSMLAALKTEATVRGVHLTTYAGTWPEVAPLVPVCDLVVCGHVAYNVPGLGGFARALSSHTNRRVVLVLQERHPWVPLGPLWQHFHHQPRPAGPTAALAIEVLREAGIVASAHGWSRPRLDDTSELWPALVAFTRARLCLPVDREPEVARLLARQPREPAASVVLHWDG